MKLGILVTASTSSVILVVMGGMAVEDKRAIFSSSMRTGTVVVIAFALTLTSSSMTGMPLGMRVKKLSNMQCPAILRSSMQLSQPSLAMVDSL